MVQDGTVSANRHETFLAEKVQRLPLMFGADVVRFGYSLGQEVHHLDHSMVVRKVFDLTSTEENLYPARRTFQSSVQCLVSPKEVSPGRGLGVVKDLSEARQAEGVVTRQGLWSALALVKPLVAHLALQKLFLEERLVYDQTSTWAKW